MLVLRHSFANPVWWTYQLYVLTWYHSTYNGVRY